MDALEVRPSRRESAGRTAAGLPQAERAGERAEPGREERRREDPLAVEGVRERACARPRAPRSRAPSPRPSPPPCGFPPLSPPPPRPALPPSPRNQCSCCLAGCGFLQSLPRPPLRPERARSPARQCPPVPSCEPRPQPRTAPRSRLPAHPPGRRGAGGGRDPGAPTLYPGEVGRGPGAGRCQLIGAASRAGSWAAGGREEGRGPRPGGRCCPPLPRARGAAWGRGDCRAGAGWSQGIQVSTPDLRYVHPGSTEQGVAASAVRRLQTCCAHGGRPASFPARRRGFLLPASATSSLPAGAAAPGAGGGCRVGSRESIFSGALPVAPLLGSGCGVDRVGLCA